MLPHVAKRRLTASLLALGLVLGFCAGGESAAATTTKYAPLDKPGPRLSVSTADLRESLSCTDNLKGAKQQPVLLVPATTFQPKEQYGWNYMRQFEQLSRPYCTVTTPKFALEDLQISGEYVVHAIRHMFQVSGRKIAVLGGSQGGFLPRWALRFWPDTRAMVEDQIGLAPPNHGTFYLRFLCPANQCAGPLHQAFDRSAFMGALNSGRETFPGIDYTVVYTEQDELVVPSSAPLSGDGAHVTNVSVQQICAGHVAQHIKMSSYDPVGYALVTDALTHDGPADPARFDRAVCLQEFPPGVHPQEAASALPTILFNTAQRFASAERTSEEPALRCYVTDTCPGGSGVRRSR